MARILLVDDDEDVLESVAEFLRRHHDVSVAAGFPQAVAALGEGPLPDVVITDYDMAPYRGDDLLAIVAARWPRVCRILHSGAPGVAQKANRLHVDHLVKKGDPNELARVIAQCILRLRWA